MGVAVRTYYTSPRHDDDYLESWLELWDGDRPAAARLRLDLRHGRRHVQRRPRASSTPAPRSARPTTTTCCASWLDQTPEEWGFREENRTAPIRGAALPMGFNRTPHYTRGCCWSATPAAWSTRSTARASRTRWSPARSWPRTIAQALARGRRAETRAGAGRLPARAEPGVRRLLHARPRLREADRPPRGDARRHPARPAPPRPDAVRPEAAGQPHRPAAATHRPGHQRPIPTRT